MIDERVPVERRETVAAFAKSFLGRLADEEIIAAPAEELYGLVCSTFEFVDGRRLQPWVVRAFNAEVADDGFTSTGTILETNVDDSPFLVDSVTEELTARNLVVRRILHPVMGTSRDEEGRLERVSSARDASHRDGIWQGLAQGVIDTIGSDHSPHTREEKAHPYPKTHSDRGAPFPPGCAGNGRTRWCR